MPTSVGGVTALFLNKGSLQAMLSVSLITTTAIGITPAAIPFDFNDLVSGTMTHSTTVNNTRFTATKAGIYVFSMQPQPNRTGLGNATFWLRQNGLTAVVNSGIIFNQKNNLETVPVIEIIPLILASGDYIEMMGVLTLDGGYELLNTAGSGSGATEIANTPAAIMVVTGYSTL